MDKITATAAALREILGGPVPAGSSVQIDLERGKLTMNHGGGPAESYGRPSSCGACLAGKQLPLGEQAALQVLECAVKYVADGHRSALSVKDACRGADRGHDRVMHADELRSAGRSLL